MAAYNIDPNHSHAHFSVKHMMIATVRGTFSGLSGSLDFDPNNFEASQVSASIPVDSISTGVADRDNHLKTGDFFEAQTHPTITFKSTGVQKLDDEEAKLTGDLTIKGITKSVSLNVTGSPTEMKDPYGLQRLGFEATTKIKRSEFGLTFNMPLETGGVVIGDDISITLDVQFLKA